MYGFFNEVLMRKLPCFCTYFHYIRILIFDTNTDGKNCKKNSNG